MNNSKKREGNYYSSKVRLFLNDYGGQNLEEFCKCENVSYTKMLNALGGKPSYRKPQFYKQHPSQKTPTENLHDEFLDLPLAPLIIDDLPSSELQTAGMPRDLVKITLNLGKKVEMRIEDCQQGRSAFRKDTSQTPLRHSYIQGCRETCISYIME